MRNFLMLLTLYWVPMLLISQPSSLLMKVNKVSDTEQYSILKQLQKYPPTDFTFADLNTLAAILRAKSTFHRDQFYLLAGYLRMEKELGLIPPELRETEKYKRNYGLAMVRAGNDFRRKQLLDKVKTLDYNDEFVYEIVPLLIYTHDREIYDYLIELTLRVDRTCESPDPHTSVKIDCGYRMMEYLASVLRDYPYLIGLSGDLEVDDYRKALIEVRRWLNRHRNDYKIVENAY